jgi:OmpA-OmpF porin, OOP family
LKKLFSFSFSKYRSWILLAFILFSISSFAQKELVPNGSFEIKKGKSNFISSAPPWKAINTVDLYHSVFFLDTTKYKGPRTGRCYTGLRFQPKYKEYMYVKLVHPLKEGTEYKFEVHLRLSAWSNVKLKSFTALFSKKLYTIRDVITEENVIDTLDKKGLEDPEHKWLKLSGTYIALGGEKYLTLGNFVANTEKDMVKIRGRKKGKLKEAYYFIDDVSLISPEDTTKPIPVVKDTVKADTVAVPKTEFKTGQVIELKNIFFETDKSELLPESFTELNKLVKVLNQNKNLEIQINGHTDNQGKNQRNLVLSEERAQAVYEYLKGQGVQNKMSYAGFGSTKPVAANSTEEGRAKNRRVEFEVLKQ